ncbi:immune inhibitor A domain-containing protein [Shewanella algae]|uniref:immune inhibitor A domain-containing protein n=1 Tax=Shewanella algae TaxID=38313 RepID=UPI001AAFB904|nr:immune inhibitor A domain-containing protein [Shewanella algae]MBO2580458.1 immune inhibitor A [Shewanella algae]
MSLKSLLALALGASCLFGATNVLAATAPADPGVINKEQILYWLVKRGELDAEASEEERQQALAAYTAKSTGAGSKAAQVLKAREQQLLQQARSNSLRQSKLMRAQSRVADTDVTKRVKVLAVLVDFPDLPYNNNRLSPGDTEMYYANYSVAHYRGLLFSDAGFPGPQGQTLPSAYQYYQAVSGQSFFFNGDVKGWFRASQNAAYYGANDPNNNNDDKAATELVEEAVAAAVATMSADELAQYDIEDPYDIDGDGNLDEPDGILDHVMIFHSSIGEEAGGGVLGDDAIWSHRFFVPSAPGQYGQAIPGSNMRLFGYTIQPLDAGTGVCTHEFGHDLGLPDEYDTSTEASDGSPVGLWSLMSGGSWAGSPRGSQPSGFSPYARSFLQDRYKGRWVNEQSLDYQALDSNGTQVTLEHANSSGVNQLAIKLPSDSIAFTPAYQGQYQYYSNQGDQLNNALSFELQLPMSTSLTLKMKAHWQIEQDYDYVQLLVDGVPLAGSHTKSSNSINNAANIISGDSAALSGGEGEQGWQEISFDLSAYAGMSKQISLVYRTDEAVGGYGFAVDDIRLESDGSLVYSDDAETALETVVLSGFVRTDDTRPGAPRRYLLQLRNYQGVDAGLQQDSYEPGLLVWYENLAYSDNKVAEHPGYGLIGVVDADQNLIGNRDSEVQVRDASFSLYPQSAFFGDTHLGNNSLFDDSDDYSAPLKPQAGLVLPKLGLMVQLLTQEQDSSQAQLLVSKRGDSNGTELSASISAQQEGGDVSFSANLSGGTAPYTYQWDFGVGGVGSTQATPQYSYSESGTYTVTLTVTDANNRQTVTSLQLTVSIPLSALFDISGTGLTVQFNNLSRGGSGELSYQWDFGDGQSSTVASPSHTYSAAGSYSVRLVVTDSQNNQSSNSRTLVVSNPVVPNTTQSSSGGGGGSLGGLSLLGLALIAWRRRR